MADTIYPPVLKQAVEILGSVQALAFELRVPEKTLLRWMSGRAQTPLLAFQRAIDVLTHYERSAAFPLAPAQPVAEKVGFTFGEVAASCPHCESKEFLSPVARGKLKMSTILACASCNVPLRYGEILAAVAARRHGTRRHWGRNARSHRRPGHSSSDEH